MIGFLVLVDFEVLQPPPCRVLGRIFSTFILYDILLQKFRALFLILFSLIAQNFHIIWHIVFHGPVQLDLL